MSEQKPIRWRRVIAGNTAIFTAAALASGATILAFQEHNQSQTMTTSNHAQMDCCAPVMPAQTSEGASCCAVEEPSNTEYDPFFEEFAP